MKIPIKYRVFSINLLISVAITLIINFSSFLILTGESRPRWMPENFVELMWVQIFVTYIFSILLLSINTVRRFSLMAKILLSLGVATALYFLFPSISRHGDWILQFMSWRLFDQFLLMKSIFMLIVALLYGHIYELVYQKQYMIIENEQLKNENLQTRYNMLANQISPHFLFNSLNSLSMLVRENLNDKAQLYIDKMADTFRYMLQSGQNEMTSLSEEIAFTEAYLYLHTIRYENKLFCQMEIDEKYLHWTLPAMSLQPLIENAVKHNSIARSKPFTITIKTVNDLLVVSNPIIPKIDDTTGTGIGLKNLTSRYQLLTSRSIKISNDGVNFEVAIPLIKP